MRMLLGFALALMFCSPLPAEDKKEKIDPSKLLGKWKLEQNGTIMELTKDGKFTGTEANRKHPTSGGTYKVEGNKLILVALAPYSGEIKMVMTITKLTDSKFVVDGEGKQPQNTWTRVKDK